jgi:hypothetical protein
MFVLSWFRVTGYVEFLNIPLAVKSLDGEYVRTRLADLLRVEVAAPGMSAGNGHSLSSSWTAATE